MSRIRQQEKAKLSREKLMAGAADELFARQKISEVGVRDIAARAGVHDGERSTTISREKTISWTRYIEAVTQIWAACCMTWHRTQTVTA